MVEGVAAFYGITFNQETPAELHAMLRPHDVWFVPDEVDNGGRRPGFCWSPGAPVLSRSIASGQSFSAHRATSCW